MQREDAWGMKLITCNERVVDLVESFVLSFVQHRADAPQRLGEILEVDPAFVPALCMRGFALRFLGRRDLLREACELQIRAADSLWQRGGSARDHALVSALGAWCEGRPEDAVSRIERSLDMHPTDLLLVKLSHGIQFMMGRMAPMRASIDRVLSAWDEEMPGYGCVLGMQAFTLEETGELDAAERVGRLGLEHEPHDAWGAHAVAHVHESRGDADGGLAWFRALGDRFDACNNFLGHLAWHQALFHIAAGEHNQALALYDERIATYPTRDYRDVVNESSLLYRLETFGANVGNRWDRLGAIASERGVDHGLAFADAHYAMCLARTDRRAEAARMLVSLRRATSAERRGHDAHVLREVGLPLVEAIFAHFRGNAARAVTLLRPLRARLQQLGGSNAQRDLFELLFIDAASQAPALDMVA